MNVEFVLSSSLSHLRGSSIGSSVGEDTMGSAVLAGGRCVSPSDMPKDREKLGHGGGRVLRELEGGSARNSVALVAPTKPVVATDRSSSHLHLKATSIQGRVSPVSSASFTPLLKWRQHWSHSFVTRVLSDAGEVEKTGAIHHPTKVKEDTHTPSLDDLFPPREEGCTTHASKRASAISQDARISGRKRRKTSHRPSPSMDPFPHPTLAPTIASRGSSSPSNLSPDPAFALADFGEKGTGIRALKTIERGSEIISESPFIRFTHPITSLSIRRAWDRLSDENKQRFLSFTSTIPDIDDRFVNIAETNAIPLCVPSSDDSAFDEEHAAAREGVSGMFKTICRVNHSCEPNACWTWSARRQSLTLRAIRDIPAGSEITASYIDDLTLARDGRQKMLFDNFGFMCCCSSCGNSAEEVRKSDQNLARYQELRLRIAEATDVLYKSPGRGRHVQTILGDVQDAMNILEDENRIEAKGELRMQIIFLYAHTGNREATIKAAKMALRHFKATIGKEGVRRTELEEWIRHPESVPYWRSCN